MSLGVTKNLGKLKPLRRILSISVAFAGMGVGQAFANLYSHPAPEGEPGHVPHQQLSVPVTIGGEPGSLTPTTTVYARLLDTSPEQFVEKNIRSQPEGTVFYHLQDGDAPFLLFVHGIYEDPSVFSDIYRQAFEAGYSVGVTKLSPDADFIANGHLLAAQLDLLRQRVPGVESRLVILGHSMGALDAYEALGRYRPLSASALVSFGTPWEGSPLANLLNRVAQWPQDPSVTPTWFGVAADRCLAPDKVKGELTALYHNNPALQSLRVISVVGTIVSPESVRSPVLQAGYAALSALGYPANDGAVPAPSQQYPYGGTTIHVNTDHNGYVKWSLVQRILETELHMPPSPPPSHPGRPSETSTAIVAQEASRSEPTATRTIDLLQDLLDRMAVLGSLHTTRSP